MHHRDECFDHSVLALTETACLHVIGQPSTEYISSESPMAAYANVHHAFEEMRVRALAAIHGSPIQEYDYVNNRRTSDPPRVMIVGPENSGKTTLCKILTNYAVNVNQGWVPVLINLDAADVRCSHCFAHLLG
jgi:polyribonucleotide 5'-hydroxyl-kinase